MDKEPKICITLSESDFLEVRDVISSASTEALLRGLDADYEHKEGSMLRHRIFDRIKDQFNDHYKNILQARAKR